MSAKPPRAPGRQRDLAPALVAVFLIALSVVPFLIQLRVGDLLNQIATVGEPARALLSELQLQLGAEATAARVFMLTRDPTYAATAEAARREHDRALAELLPLTRSIGPAAEEEAAELTRALALADSLTSGQFREGAVDRVLASLPQRQVVFARATAAVARLDGIVAQETAAQRQAIRSTQRTGVLVTSGLGVLALAAAGVVMRLIAERRRTADERGRLLAAERSARAASEQAHAEAELRRVELERVTESRAGLMRGFSHDMKNPLGAASGYVELLEDGVMGPVTEQQKSSLEGARRAIDAAIRLIEELGELARAEGIEVRSEPVNLCRLVEELTLEHRAQGAAKDLELSAVCADVVGTIDTDALRVRQILGNLLSNAIKYTPAGGVTVRTSMRDEERAGRAGLWAVVEVEDDGPGIPADQQGLLFKEFQRLSTADGTVGAGIGLAISRRLARALGGDISVESEVGRGSTFGLWLPVH